MIFYEILNKCNSYSKLLYSKFSNSSEIQTIEIQIRIKSNLAWTRNMKLFGMDFDRNYSIGLEFYFLGKKQNNSNRNPFRTVP